MPSLITPALTYTVYANDLENTTQVISPNDIPDIDSNTFNDEQKRKIGLMFKLSPELKLTDEGKLYLNSDTESIKKTYSMNQEDLDFVTNSINNYNDAISTPVYTTRASYSGGYIHLSYSEVVNIVNLAANYGPGVIAGAMSAILSFYPGIGTIIGGIVGYVGSATILQAMSDATHQKKGIKIGIGGISAE